MPSFCPVFNCLNSADRKKIKSNSLIVKNNVKEVLNFSNVRREEWLAQISGNI